MFGLKIHMKDTACCTDMDAIFPMTVTTIAKDQEEAAKMAVYFWSILCEQELDLEDEGKPTYQYMAKAMPHLMPTLLSALEKPNDDGEGDENDLCDFAGACITLIAATTKDSVVEHVLPYVSNHVQHSDWKKRDAAISAFGCILDGPQDEEKMGIIIDQAMGILVTSLGDENARIKADTAWTISRIAQSYSVRIPATQLMPLLENLVKALDEEPRVVNKACSALHALAENKSKVARGQPWLTANILGPIIKALLKVVERDDGDECNIRVTAYETLNMLIEVHDEDSRPIILELCKWILQRFDQSLATNCLTDEDKQNNYELRDMLAASMNYICRTCNKDQVKDFGDRLMQCLLHALAQKTSAEIFLCISAFATEVEDSFER